MRPNSRGDNLRVGERRKHRRCREAIRIDEQQLSASKQDAGTEDQQATWPLATGCHDHHHRGESPARPGSDCPRQRYSRLIALSDYASEDLVESEAQRARQRE